MPTIREAGFSHRLMLPDWHKAKSLLRSSVGEDRERRTWLFWGVQWFQFDDPWKLKIGSRSGPTAAGTSRSPATQCERCSRWASAGSWARGAAALRPHLPRASLWVTGFLRRVMCSLKLEKQHFREPTHVCTRRFTQMFTAGLFVSRKSGAYPRCL